jgi:hypothetical protein
MSFWYTLSYMISKTQKEVFLWIVKILKKEGIAFQATGGLATILYGAKRNLFDIDIDVAKKDIEKVRKLFKEYIAEDLNHLQNGRFDIYVMTLKIRGVIIDIGQAEESYVIDKNGNKIGGVSDLNKAKIMKIDGMAIPVEDKDELIKYKQILGRDTDLIDITEMTKAHQKQ